MVSYGHYYRRKVPENCVSAAFSPCSCHKGDIENTAKQIQGMARTLKMGLETRLDAEIPEEHPIIPWLIRHGANILNRYHVGKDGFTAHRRARGRDFKKEVCEFGECVWYLKPKSKGKKKLQSRWASGIWLGIWDESSEIIIGTNEGCIKVRTVRRKGTDTERWNVVQIQEMKGTPWEPTPGSTLFFCVTAVAVSISLPNKTERLSLSLIHI